MSTTILDTYSNHFKIALQEITGELLELEFSEDKEIEIIDNKIVNVIVGMTGAYRGRLLLELEGESAKEITEIMNFGPLEEENDLYLYMGEFVNMLSGRAITYINNDNKDKIIRLTPPAIFSGKKLDLTTPNIGTQNLYYRSNNIKLKMNIGFEGV